MDFRMQLTALALLVGANHACMAQQTQQPGLGKFLPNDATLVDQLSVNFGDKTGIGTVIVYVSGSAPSIATGIVVIQNNAVVFEESDGVTNGAGVSDALRIDKLTARNGKEGVLVILKTSGAGTATQWHIVASVGGRINRLNPEKLREKILHRSGYVDNGYNDVKSKGDLVIESLPGYSPHRARCCPNRPSLEMTFRFVGNSVVPAAVHELPYRVPKSDQHSPPLRLPANR
jgi:hypothetical protein